MMVARLCLLPQRRVLIPLYFDNYAPPSGPLPKVCCVVVTLHNLINLTRIQLFNPITHVPTNYPFPKLNSICEIEPYSLKNKSLSSLHFHSLGSDVSDHFFWSEYRANRTRFHSLSSEFSHYGS